MTEPQDAIPFDDECPVCHGPMPKTNKYCSMKCWVMRNIETVKGDDE